MELLATIVMTAIVLGGLLWTFSRSAATTYRPDRRKTADLLKKVIEGDALQQSWDLFIGYPILHDPELEEIRQRCIVLSEGDEEHPGYPSGIGRYIFNRAGRQEVEKILKDLEQLMAEEPFSQDF